MQQDIVDAVRSERMLGDLREEDIGDRFVRHLVESKGWERRACEEVVGKMMKRWDEFYRELSEWEKEREVGFKRVESEVIVVDSTVEDGKPLNSELADSNPSPSPPATISKKKAVSEAKFMIVYSRNRKFARLHKAKEGCPWTRVSLNDFTLHDLVVPKQYNKRCKLCWSSADQEDDSSDTSSPSE
jgi:hypothetical protein